MTRANSLAPVVWLVVALTSGVEAQQLRPADAPGLHLWGDRVFESEVVRVVSGDSLVVNDGGGELLVRLARVVAPDEPGGEDPGARSYLANQLGIRVTIRIERESVSGRAARGRILSNGADVRRGLVASGLVWYCRASKQEATLEAAESEARRAGLGLWGKHERPLQERDRACSESAV